MVLVEIPARSLSIHIIYKTIFTAHKGNKITHGEDVRDTFMITAVMGRRR